MVRLFPNHSFVIHVPDPPSVVTERLKAGIKVPNTRWISFHHPRNPLRETRIYEGDVTESGFKVSRVNYYNNSFLPQIQGRLSASLSVTTVFIFMRIRPLVFVLLACWLILWYGFHLWWWVSSAFPIQILLIGLVAPIGLVVLFWLSFWLEAYRSHRKLTKILLGQPLNLRQSFLIELALYLGLCFLGAAISVCLN